MKNVRQVLAALLESDQLESFQTTLGFTEDSAVFKLPFPAGLRQQLQRRTYEIAPDKLRTAHFREAIRLLLKNSASNPLTAHETGVCSVDQIYQALDRKVAQHIQHNANSMQAVYAYEDGCLHTFDAAKAAGIQSIYELPIAYGPFAQKLLKEEAERLPAWEKTLIATRDSVAKIERKIAEADLADVIICPSSFVKSSLPEALQKKKKIFINPYGATPIEAKQSSESKNADKLKVLYAGTLTQRKGIADLFAAMKLISSEQIELTVIGSLVESLEFYKNAYPHFHYISPQPRAAVLELMQNHDVLVLPSLIEGRALVQLEAMGCGLPVITTTHAGGDDLIDAGSTGFLVPIRSPESIAEQIDWFATNRQQIPDMRQACIQKAEANNWKYYRERLIQFLKTFH